MFGQAVGDTPHAVLKQGRAEVDQQSELFISKTNLGQDLFAVNGRKLFNRLELNNHEVLDNHISAKSFFKDQIVVTNRNCDLALNFQSALPQLVGKDHFIDCFQQSWTKALMNLKSSVHNYRRHIILGHSKLMISARVRLLNFFAPLRLCVRHF